MTSTHITAHASFLRTLARRWPILVMCGLALIFLLLLVNSFSMANPANAHPLPYPGQQSQPTPSPTPIIGEPCGRTEKLSPSAFCLHGSVLNAEGEALSNITVTVTDGESRVDGQTSRHPGQPRSKPTFGLDISVITPTFLMPITVTASDGNVTVTRQMIVLPDLRTHNQQMDLRLPEQRPPNLRIFGYVYDFPHSKIASSAVVTVEYKGKSLPVSTSLRSEFDPQPVFVLDSAQLASIGVTDTTPVTLTAKLNDMIASDQVILQPGAQQVNFVTGWPCDGDGVLPRISGDGVGLPRTSGDGVGLPDEACIWGEARVDGKVTAGVEVYVTTPDGKSHSGFTHSSHAGQPPRYAIRVSSAMSLTDKSFVATGVLDGFTGVVTRTYTGELAQRVDIDILTAAPISNINRGNPFRVAWFAPNLWVAQGGQLVRYTPFDPENPSTVLTQTTLIYSSTHGLPSTNLSHMHKDRAERFWFVGQGVTIYDPKFPDPRFDDSTKPNNPAAWLTLTQTHGLLGGGCCGRIRFDSQARAWFVNTPFDLAKGVNRIEVLPRTSSSSVVADVRTFTSSHGLLDDFVTDLVIDSQDNVWLLSSKGVSRISPSLSITTLTTATLGLSGYAASFQLDPSNNLWVKGSNGKQISRITPNLTSATFVISGRIACDQPLCPYPANWLGASGFIGAIQFDTTGNAWLNLSTGVDRIAPSLGVTPFLTSELGLDGNVSFISVDANNNLWVLADESLVHVHRDSLQHTLFTTTTLGVKNLAFVLDDRNNAWVRDQNSLARIEGTTLRPTRFPSSTLGGDEQSYIYGPLFDADDNAWLYGTRGVIRIDANTLITQIFPSEQLGLAGSVSELASDGRGNLWALADCDQRVSRWQPESQTWQVFTISKAQYSCHIFTAKSDYLWYERDNSETTSAAISADTRNSIERSDQQTSVNTLSKNDLPDFEERGNGVLEQVFERPSDQIVRLKGPENVFAGDQVTYTMLVSNTGASWVQPRLSLTLPTGSQIVSSNSAITPPVSFPFTPMGPVIWALDWLTPESGALTVTAQVVLTTTPNQPITVTAALAASTNEGTQLNNQANWHAKLRDPKPNLRVAVVGPPLITDGETVLYTIWVDNIGGSIVNDAQLKIEAPADVPAINVGQLEINGRRRYELRLNSQILSVSVSSSLAESDLTDNSAQANVPINANIYDTLFVVAGDQMAQNTGHGASQLLTRLYTIPQERMRSIVLDVGRAMTVAQAYADWNENLDNQNKARDVAKAIRDEIKAFLVTHSNIRYVVFIGGDEVIPFYRVRDISKTHWEEKTYGKTLPEGTVREALRKNYYLTDDFYTDDHATAPDSKRWPDDDRPLYLPDRVTARLVETPAEILAAINAFLQSNGQMQIGPGSAILSGDKTLTIDTIESGCKRLGGAVSLCTDDEPNFATRFTEANWSMACTASHANQMQSGELAAMGIQAAGRSYAGTLWASIGCHSGLNVPDVAGNPPSAYDLMQAFVNKGGVAIAPTAYGYASKRKQPGYSEKFLLGLVERVQEGCKDQTIGAAFIATKHRFFAQAEHSFDGLDEKALLPLTLYGLPHWRIDNGSIQPCTDALLVTTSSQLTTTAALTPTVVTITVPIDPALLQPRSVPPIGTYYDYSEQILAQDGRPIQPEHHISITAALPGGAWPHGVVLLEATYQDKSDFDPVIEQAWIISALRQDEPEEEVEPTVVITGWDHNVPHSLGFYRELTGALDSHAVASINLVLGACNAVTENPDDVLNSQVRCQPERLFGGFTLATFYSTNPDDDPPGITNVEAFVAPNITLVSVAVTESLTTAIAVCDDGKGRYRSGKLVNRGDTWIGSCPTAAQHYFVQAVDEAGNVTNSDWHTPGPAQQSFMPQVLKDYRTLRSDLIPLRVYLAEDGALAADLQNIGKGWVYNDFWVDLCFMNSQLPGIEPPTKEDDVCRGRAHDYLVWLVRAGQTPIPPNGIVTLRLGEEDPTESVFTHTIAARTPIYLHVDSTNAQTTYGGVWEEDEDPEAQHSYNNVNAEPFILERELHPVQATEERNQVTPGGSPPVRVQPDALPGDDSAEPSITPDADIQFELWLPIANQ